LPNFYDSLYLAPGNVAKMFDSHKTRMIVVKKL